jgi:hypothetical protein
VFRKGEVMNENPQPVLEIESTKEAPMVKNVRDYITKTGKLRKDKLKPLIYHDNRNGPYNYGKNASKRAKKALKNK